MRDLPAKPRLVWIVAKWFSTLLSLALAFLFLFSLVYGITWDSPGLTYQFGLILGAVSLYEWNPGFLAATSSPPLPGWSGWGTYWGNPQIDLLPHFETTRMGSGFILPLWIPAVLVGAVAAIFWWWQRRTTAAFLRSVLARLRPARPLRLRVWRVVIASALVFLFGALATMFIEALPSANFAHPRNGLNRSFQKWTIHAFIHASPVLGVLLAWQWVRFRNRLLYAKGDLCRGCGYNLTGNLSGVCPECGAAVSRLRDV